MFHMLAALAASTMSVQAPAPVPPLPLSAAGRAVLEEAMREAGLRDAVRAERSRQAGEAIAAAAARRPIDLAALRAAYDRRDAVDVQALRERTTAAMALLDRLSPEDRVVIVDLIPELAGVRNEPAPR